MNRIYKQQIQNYLLAMVTKILKIISILILLTTLTGCPGDEDCFDIGSTSRVDDLISLTPLQTNYNHGDIITFKITVPNTNHFFGEQINLFEKTNDYEAFLLTSYSNLFKDNQLTFIFGNQGTEPNWFNVPLNFETNNYVLEVKIKLNKTGTYTIHTDDYILFQGSSECNRYLLDTNIAGRDSEGKIEFTVQ